MSEPSIEIVVPTLGRGQILLDSLESIINLEAPVKIQVIDQTQDHPADIARELSRLNDTGKISWIRRSEPSVVKAMNVGLLNASADYVLFLDDDIVPRKDLIYAHLELLREQNIAVVAGRVIQPWDDPKGSVSETTPLNDFNSLQWGEADYFIGANFLVNRKFAIQIGGFDENFVGTSHDYEREFSDRVIGHGGVIRYNGKAAIQHLKAPAGGIRSHGHFLKTIKPHHAVGAYYYILVGELRGDKLKRIFRRLKERIITKTHLKSPWWIPVTFIGDMLGILWASWLKLKGPRHLKQRQ